MAGSSEGQAAPGSQPPPAEWESMGPSLQAAGLVPSPGQVASALS